MGDAQFTAPRDGRVEMSGDTDVWTPEEQCGRRAGSPHRASAGGGRMGRVEGQMGMDQWRKGGWSCGEEGSADGGGLLGRREENRIMGEGRRVEDAEWETEGTRI